MRHRFLALACVLLTAVACSAVPVSAPQSAHQDSGAPMQSPVERNWTYAPTTNTTNNYFVGSGTGNAPATTPTSTGLDNAGDQRAAESLRTGVTGGTIAPVVTTTVDPTAVAKGIVDSADAIMKLPGLSPTGTAMILAKQAKDLAATKPDDAKKILAQAQEAAKTETPAPPAAGTPK